MTTAQIAESTKHDVVRTTAQERPAGGVRFDWGAAILSAILMSGMYLDGSAHNHGLPDSFFTPWHGILFSALVALAAYLAIALVRNHTRGYPWLRALPAGYGLSLMGAIVFNIAFAGDMIWHEIFGIEANVEAMLSPTHLLQAISMWAMVSGPLRAALKRSDAGSHNIWTEKGPMLLSLTATVSGFMFMTQFVHPLHTPWAVFTASGESFLMDGLGVAAVLLQAAFLTGMVLLAVRRWGTTLPLGSFTLVFTLNAFAMATQQDHYELVPTAALAGLAVDLFLKLLKPSAARPDAFRLFAIAVPLIYYLLYFLALEITVGISWSITLWGGTIIFAGIVGSLLSYLIVLPSGFVEQPELAHIQ